MPRFHLNSAVLALLLALWAGPAWAGSMALLGVGGPTAAAPSYTGPGDIKSGAIFWVGLRAYSGAYASAHGNVADFCNSTGASCVTVTANTNGSITLPGATACGGSACTKVKTLYNQANVGVGDFTQSTASKMPALSTANLGGLPTAVFTAANSSCLVGITSAALAIPVSWSMVMEVPSGGATAVALTYGFGDGSSITLLTTSTWRIFDAANVIDASAAADAFHAAQAIQKSGAGASQFYIDGSSTTGTMTTSPMGAGDASSIGGNAVCSSNFQDMTLAETGFWNADLSSPDVRATMNSNQHTYWGF